MKSPNDPESRWDGRAVLRPGRDFSFGADYPVLKHGATVTLLSRNSLIIRPLKDFTPFREVKSH